MFEQEARGDHLLEKLAETLDEKGGGCRLGVWVWRRSEVMNSFTEK